FRKKGQALPFVITAAVRTNAPPVVDGKLSDACWAQAAVADEFVLFGGKGMATEKTDARVLWDDSNLYIGMRCFDSDVTKLKKEATDRDGAVFDDDCVEIFFIPPGNPVLEKVKNAASRYFHIAVNALGTCADETGMNTVERWNARWGAKTSIHKDRWEVELAMPWSALKTQPTDGDVWAVNFNRGLPKRGKLSEYSGWSITFAGFHDPDHFGKMIFVDRQANPGAKLIDPKNVARLVRAAELDPLLEQMLALVSGTQAELRALSKQTKLPQVAAALAAADKLVAQTAARERAL
ncbi:MAG: carbohydrate binding family 9 domain-containing protein, partial [bacterium]|nr:carbohydrate binding family 9 domain-containing protein [bacterium]